MKKNTVVVAMAAFAIVAPLASAVGAGLQGSCRFYCHVKDGSFGWYGTSADYLSGDTKLEVYKIVRDGNGNPTGLGTKVASTGECQSSLGSTGYNYVLTVTTSTDASAGTAAVPGEQLALVVKKGDATVWTSYTALPPVAHSSVKVDGFEASGIVDASFNDANCDGIGDGYAAAFQDMGVSLGADADYDGDGLTDAQEFMYGTDPSGGLVSAYWHDAISLKGWSVLNETTRKATVTIDCAGDHVYTIRYTADLKRTGKAIEFSTTADGAANTTYLYQKGGEDPVTPYSQQVWFTLPDPEEVGSYYVGIAVDGVLAAYKRVAAVSYAITWLNAGGAGLGTTEVEAGGVPSHADPTKADEGVYSYLFAGWTPALEAAVSNTTYTATYTKVVDLSKLTGNYTAVDGDAMINSTTYSVTISAGARVTMNGVTVKGASGGSGGAAVDAPSFNENGDSAVTKFEHVSGNTWSVTAFAEMEGESRGTDVTDAMVKVYSADTLDGLKAAEPMDGGVVVEERKSAVKAKLTVTVPGSPASQFFKVKFVE